MKHFKEFNRQPRILPELPQGKIEIAPPPAEYAKPEISWAGILFPPIIMSIVTILVALSMKSFFMMVSIVMTGMTLIGSLANASNQIKKYHKNKKNREKKYLEYIKDCSSELQIAREKQVKALNEMFPDTQTCLSRIEKIDNRLWEKTPSFIDFLNVRIGVGNAPSSTEIQYQKQGFVMESDPLMGEAQKMASTYQHVQNVPIACPLVDAQISGISGEHDKTSEMVMKILLQLITHQGPDDLKIIVLTDEERIEQYGWLKFVPHVWNEQMESRYLLGGKGEAHIILSELSQIIQNRELQDGRQSQLPYYLFVIEDESLLENEPISKYLYKGAKEIGVLALFTSKSQAQLPMNCNLIINCLSKTGEVVNRLNGFKAPFISDEIDYKLLEQAGRSMGSLRLKSKNGSFEIPKSVTLNELYGLSDVEEWDAVNAWMNHKTYQGLSVPIGHKAGKKRFSLDIHETGFGPHGLVAGTTGSGKSEVLQTIIISLAMNYHPHDLVFVLIDYKGGGMADVFKELPHLVGTITNLGGNQTNRALLSIKSELKRRQRIFARFDVNNIDKYQKLFYQSNRGDMPEIPHLIMIADEFAELKQDQPDFMKELVSAARVGRSLGIHLILATQKPAGVVDEQIWSNSKFKLCLKVQDIGDSNDVIKKPDAAFLKEPGRAYIQVGNDEVFDLFQAAYSGADYNVGNQLIQDNQPKRIFSIDWNGKTEKIYPLIEEKIQRKEYPSQLKVMVDHLKNQANTMKIQRIEGPWIPPLNDEISLDKLVANDRLQMEETKSINQEICCIPIGMQDYPQEQLQEVLAINFADDGNLAVFGASGTGKSYMLKVLAISAALKYNPETLNIYGLDFGGGSLKKLNEIPHCGGIIQFEEEVEIGYFMQFLGTEMERRKNLFISSDVDHFQEYRQKVGILPSILIVIDNYFGLSEGYPDHEERMQNYLRDGNRYGIYFVITASNPSMIRYRVTAHFRQVLTFALSDMNEMGNVVGRLQGLEISDKPGRGILKHNPPLEIQVASLDLENKDFNEIVEKIKQDTHKLGMKKVSSIPSMEEEIREPINPSEHFYLGKDFKTLSPFYLDFSSYMTMLIATDGERDAHDLVLRWVEAIAKAKSKVEWLCFDSTRMELYPMLAHENVVDLKAAEDFDAMLSELKEEIETRKRDFVEFKKSGNNIDQLYDQWQHKIIVINNLSELTNDSDQYNFCEFLEGCIKSFRGLKITLWVLDELVNLGTNWHSLAKMIKDEQTGILLGYAKEQNIFNIRIPYGESERLLGEVDGYVVFKNKHAAMRFTR